MNKYLNDRGFKILTALDLVAQNHRVEPAAVALAWLLHQPAITAPIASVTSLAQLESFKTAINLKLTVVEVNALNEASRY